MPTVAYWPLFRYNQWYLSATKLCIVICYPQTWILLFNFNVCLIYLIAKHLYLDPITRCFFNNVELTLNYCQMPIDLLTQRWLAARVGTRYFAYGVCSNWIGPVPLPFSTYKHWRLFSAKNLSGTIEYIVEKLSGYTSGRGLEQPLYEADSDFLELKAILRPYESMGGKVNWVAYQK